MKQRHCMQCGRDFVFKGTEQKFWYETLGFYGTSVPIRCAECRRKKRNAETLTAQIALAKAAVRKSPSDPAELLNLVESIVRSHQQTGHGKIEEAITAARRARLLDSSAHESVFWEACCHAQEGRKGKARELLTHFLQLPVLSRKQQNLSKECRLLLDEMIRP